MEIGRNSAFSQGLHLFAKIPLSGPKELCH